MVTIVREGSLSGSPENLRLHCVCFVNEFPPFSELLCNFSQSSTGNFEREMKENKSEWGKKSQSVNRERTWRMGEKFLLNCSQFKCGQLSKFSQKISPQRVSVFADTISIIPKIQPELTWGPACKTEGDNMVLINSTDLPDFSPNPVNIAALGSDDVVFTMDKLYPALLQCFAIIICGWVRIPEKFLSNHSPRTYQFFSWKNSTINFAPVPPA